ncbi:MAG: 4Fe-4S binding protein [Candidatus Eiseniibacteriota bacterium]|nr:MAG: 4Fe-4S binding protein [Candidatus Eisenbacteria bacterium]
MCEFCLKHGEGKRWYLQAKNYSDDLLSDVRRRKFIERFFTNVEALEEDVEQLNRLEKAPAVLRGMIKRVITRRMKRDHFGQVVPIEDVEQIFNFVNSIIRVACICRHITLGEEKRYCYGISLSPSGGKLGQIFRGLDKSFLNGPDTQGIEAVSGDVALSDFRAHEREGLCHTVWTFQAPFIGGICNCDRADCLAMRSTVTESVPVMFRAEYVAALDRDLCTGCRECMRVCQFGALTYSASNAKASIDRRWCYGCGICRSVCKKDAIKLEERREVPVTANLW